MMRRMCEGAVKCALRDFRREELTLRWAGSGVRKASSPQRALGRPQAHPPTTRCLSRFSLPGHQPAGGGAEASRTWWSISWPPSQPRAKSTLRLASGREEPTRTIFSRGARCLQRRAVERPRLSQRLRRPSHTNRLLEMVGLSCRPALDPAPQSAQHLAIASMREKRETRGERDKEEV